MATAMLPATERPADEAPARPLRSSAVRFVELPERAYLAFDGVGAPGARAFRDAIAALYAVAWTLHVDLKRVGLEASVGHLEALWERFDGAPVAEALAGPAGDPASWRWTLLLQLPDGVRDDQVIAAVVATRRRKPDLPIDQVHTILLEEGAAIEALHTGPYDSEAETIRRMVMTAQAVGLEPIGPHHEIYLGDPRRSRPEKLRTLLRQSVRAAG